MNMVECEDWKGREGIKLYSKEWCEPDGEGE
jgi:hypothetical protein